MHTVLSVQNLFPHQYKNYLFVSVGVIDSSNFKGAAEIEALKKQTDRGSREVRGVRAPPGLPRRVCATRSARRPSTQVVALCDKIREEFPRSIFYLGQLVFENDKFYYRFLHNETAFAIQRRLQFSGLQAVVLPIRVLDERKKGKKATRAA